MEATNTIVRALLVIAISINGWYLYLTVYINGCLIKRAYPTFPIYNLERGAIIEGLPRLQGVIDTGGNFCRSAPGEQS